MEIPAKKGFYSIVLAGYLGLLGCGGGGSVSRPPQPSVSQTVSLVNDVDIDYAATLLNVAQATRTITHNGAQIGTTTITFSPYDENLNDMEKGEYRFDLTAGGVSDTDLLTIPNYAPISNFDSLETNLSEGSSRTFNLESLISDKNPEDIPIPLVSAKTLKGGIETSISGHILTITSTGALGPYQVEVTYGSEEGGLAKKAIQGNVAGFMHVKGQLQDARTNTLGLKTNEQGIIHAYNAADNAFLKEYLIDSQGNFDFKSEQEVSEIYLQARIDLEIPLIGLTDGFVRTMKITPGSDTTNILIRAYPYNEILFYAGVNKADFRKHLEEINPYLWKSKVGNIEIVDINPLNGSSFTPEFMNLVKNKILNPNDIGCYMDPVEMVKTLNVQIDGPNSTKHYHIEGPNIVGEQGWGILYRDIDVNGGLFSPGNGYAWLVIIGPEFEPLATHEFGHAFIAQAGHALTLLAGTQTIMRSDELGRLTPGPADCEAAKIVYEKTYEIKEGETITIEPYSNTLGFGFCSDGLEFCPKK